MNRTLIMLTFMAALALTACERKSGEATDVAINVDGTDGSTTVTSADGKVSINAPGVKAEINNPGINLAAEDFDIDGVELYKGSTIRTMNVNAVEQGAADKSSVKVGFESPADAKTVADWFEKEMKAEGFKTTRSGYDLSGTTKDGDAFSLKIGDLGGGKASGLVTITGD